MSYLDWHVGDKIVCINDEEFGGYGTEILPSKGQIYTIRAFVPDRADGTIGVYLREIVNCPRVYEGRYREGCFSVSRFRPVQTRKTDISIFEAMLTGAKTKVPA